MVDPGVRAFILLRCLCDLWTACCESDLSTNADPHSFAHMDSAADIDARPIANFYRYIHCHDNA